MVLIDTHVLLWLLFDDDKLSNTAKNALENNKCCVSIVSFWELALKTSLGKLRLPKTLSQILLECEKMAIDVVNVTFEDCLTVQTLPFIHRDPFDRMIISHAMMENMPLVTHDGNIHKYNTIEVVW